MKISVIDIGSNSVRLMMWADGKALYKRVNTTRLGAGLATDGWLSDSAISRTAAAVREFAGLAKREGAEAVYAFATEAVRAAVNGGELVKRVYSLCGVAVAVLSGEEEARIGLLGALGTGDGGVIDVGGASTEITVRRGGEVIYSKSVGIGAVRLLDLAGRDLDKINAIVAERVREFGKIPCEGLTMYAIGGTSTRIAAFARGINKYDAAAIHGTVLTAEEVEELAQRLTTLSVEEIARNEVCKSSADAVGGGAAIFAEIMRAAGIKSITESESDNLEGYVIYGGLS